MSIQRVKLAKAVEIRLAGSGTVTFTLLSDMPGGTLASRSTKVITAATDERAYTWRLPGSTRGRLFALKAEAAGGASARIEGVRVLVRVLDPAKVFDWGWVAVPVTPTAQAYARIALPLESTPIAFARVPLPIPPTPAQPQWLDLPMDA